MLDYYRHIRERLRQNRPDAVFTCRIFGDAKQGMDLTFGSFFQTEKGALAEVGLDVGQTGQEPGICVYPNGMYGRRDLGNLIADAGVSDSVADPEIKKLGFGFERAFGFGNAYFEDQGNVHVSELGDPGTARRQRQQRCRGRRRPACARKVSLCPCRPGFRHASPGRHGYTFGRPAEYHEWLAEYLQLPKQPFMPLAAAQDPVAVWYSGKVSGVRVQSSEKDSNSDTRNLKPDSSLYFYAVNREPYPVTVTLS